MSNNILLRVKVTNIESKEVYTHNQIPLEHVEILKLSPDLKIEVLGQVRGAYDKRSRKENSN